MFFSPDVPQRNCSFLARFIAANISKKQYLQEQVCLLLSFFRGNSNGRKKSQRNSSWQKKYERCEPRTKELPLLSTWLYGRIYAIDYCT